MLEILNKKIWQKVPLSSICPCLVEAGVERAGEHIVFWFPISFFEAAEREFIVAGCPASNWRFDKGYNSLIRLSSGGWMAGNHAPHNPDADRH